jgi:hypothetical protein
MRDSRGTKRRKQTERKKQKLADLTFNEQKNIEKEIKDLEFKRLHSKQFVHGHFWIFQKNKELENINNN